MELYKEILAYALAQGEVKISFPGETVDVSKIVEGQCYQALQKIKDVIESPWLKDEECFERIEEIVHVLEGIGSGGGSRHDFG